jgi:hypothetical protein
MKALIVFDESSRVPPHTADIDAPPRRGDWIDLPDVSSRGQFPVERVIWLLTRAAPGATMVTAPPDSPQLRLHLGPSQEQQ